jgi:hypothetical protein
VRVDAPLPPRRDARAPPRRRRSSTDTSRSERAAATRARPRPPAVWVKIGSTSRKVSSRPQNARLFTSGGQPRHQNLNTACVALAERRRRRPAP